MAVGDINGDGNRDVVAFNSGIAYKQRIGVVLGDSEGGIKTKKSPT